MSLVVAEITVDKHGGFAGCVGHAYAGNPQMGPYVCSRLKLRALFKPARGADGAKVTGIYRKMIIVANVRKETSFPSPHFGIHVPGSKVAASENPFEIQFYLNANGQMSDCTLIDEVGINQERHKQVVDPSVIQSACAEVPVQLKPVPPRDKHGNPVPTAQNALVVIDAPMEQHNQ